MGVGQPAPAHPLRSSLVAFSPPVLVPLGFWSSLRTRCRSKCPPRSCTTTKHAAARHTLFLVMCSLWWPTKKGGAGEVRKGEKCLLGCGQAEVPALSPRQLTQTAVTAPSCLSSRVSTLCPLRAQGFARDPHPFSFWEMQTKAMTARSLPSIKPVSRRSPRWHPSRSTPWLPLECRQNGSRWPGGKRAGEIQ